MIFSCTVSFSLLYLVPYFPLTVGRALLYSLLHAGGQPLQPDSRENPRIIQALITLVMRLGWSIAWWGDDQKRGPFTTCQSQSVSIF